MQVINPECEGFREICDTAGGTLFLKILLGNCSYKRGAGENIAHLPRLLSCSAKIYDQFAEHHPMGIEPENSQRKRFRTGKVPAKKDAIDRSRLHLHRAHGQLALHEMT